MRVVTICAHHIPPDSGYGSFAAWTIKVLWVRIAIVRFPHPPLDSDGVRSGLDLSKP